MKEYILQKPPSLSEVPGILGALEKNDRLIITDSDNPRFDVIKFALFDHSHIGTSPIDGKQTWIGTRRQMPSQPEIREGRFPVIISYFTVDTPYEDEAKKLTASCESLGLKYCIEGVPSFSKWEANCAYKARYVYEKWKELNAPVMWIDADAIVKRTPLLLYRTDVDFAIHKIDRWEIASGTIFFNQTDPAEKLLQEWMRRCENASDTWDQHHLDMAWESVASRHPIKTLWLPQSYTRIFDRKVIIGEDPLPVIEHYQASRKYKTLISNRPVTPVKNYPQRFMMARSASRMYFTNTIKAA